MMKEVKLSVVGNTPVGSLGFDDAMSYRFTGTKDLHDAELLSKDSLAKNFYDGYIELYFVIEDEEYILINDNEREFERPMK